MISAYKYVAYYSKNIMFLKYICSPIEMITVYTCYYREKLRLPVLKSFQPIINLVFEFNNTIEPSLRILYFTPNFIDMLFIAVCVCRTMYVWPSQPGKVANPARGQQLNRENELFAVLVRA